MKGLRLVLSTLLVGVLPSVALAEPLQKLPESARLRVLAWYSVPAEESTVERMTELAKAGFTDSFSNYPSIESVLGALDAAQTAGVKLWPHLEALRQDPEGTVRKLQNQPALGGYMLTDEPGADQFASLATWAAQIRAVDATHPCYINLFPNYSNPRQTKVSDYSEYIERFVSEVPVPFISFDHYPVLGDSLRPAWYDNLATIADAAQEARRPFWAFALSVALKEYPGDEYPVAQLAHLRLEVYSDLAYGAQTIQYFTYWTPPSSPAVKFHDGPIDIEGHRTPVYDRVKEVNAELKALSPVFVGSHVESVGHTGARLPLGTQRYQPTWPIKELEANSGAVVSHLANGERRYLLVLNRSFQDPMEFSVALDPAAEASLVGKDGGLRPLAAQRYQATVPPGDIAILTWAATRGKQ